MYCLDIIYIELTKAFDYKQLKYKIEWHHAATKSESLNDLGQSDS